MSPWKLGRWHYGKQVSEKYARIIKLWKMIEWVSAATRVDREWPVEARECLQWNAFKCCAGNPGPEGPRTQGALECLQLLMGLYHQTGPRRQAFSPSNLSDAHQILRPSKAWTPARRTLRVTIINRFGSQITDCIRDSFRPYPLEKTNRLKYCEEMRKFP